MQMELNTSVHCKMEKLYIHVSYVTDLTHCIFCQPSRVILALIATVNIATKKLNVGTLNLYIRLLESYILYEEFTNFNSNCLRKCYC